LPRILQIAVQCQSPFIVVDIVHDKLGCWYSIVTLRYVIIYWVLKLMAHEPSGQTAYAVSHQDGFTDTWPDLTAVKTSGRLVCHELYW